MEIVKELNLNKNPKNYKNNSMFFAKNVKLDENGSNIVRDDGIELIKRIHDTLNPAYIVNCFATINELIYFVVVDEDASHHWLRIYRYNEEHKTIIKYRTEIPWNPYKQYNIAFDYLYNNGNELIISFCFLNYF